MIGRRLARVRGDRSLLVVAGAAGLGLVLRVVWVVVAARPPQGLFDPARYAGYARAISAGRGMVEPLTGQPTAYFPPGYPWFLGVVEAVISRTPLPDDLALVAGLAQAGLGAASVVLAGLLARRLHSPAAGAVAALVVAVYPNLVLHAGVLLSETLAIALLLALLLALVPPGSPAVAPSGSSPPDDDRGGDRPGAATARPEAPDPSEGADPAPAEGQWPAGLSRSRLVAAGLLLGGLLLVRPVSAGVVLAVAACWAVAGIGWRRVATWSGLVVGLAVLCVVPWTVRNAIRMDAFVPLSTNTGDNLCIGHGPLATGAFRGAPDCATGTGVQHGTAAEVAADREKTRRALRAIRDGWRDEPGLVVDRFRYTMDRDDDAVRAVQSYGLDPWLGARSQLWLRRACAVAWTAVGLVGLVGLIGLARPGRRSSPRWAGDRLLVPLTALALLAAPLATFGDARFKVPIVPLLAIAAATAVTRRRPISPPT